MVEGEEIEISPQTLALSEKIANILSYKGPSENAVKTQGCALVMDYGVDRLPNNTFRVRLSRHHIYLYRVRVLDIINLLVL